MIELSSHRWLELTHAYGSAADIPQLLHQLAGKTEPATSHNDEPWFSLWSSLCHQGDVYEASYAALPHIVAIGWDAQKSIDFGFFQLPAAIEIARLSGNGPPVPTDLDEAYGNALHRLTECFSRHIDEAWDEAMFLSAVSALAVSKGHNRAAKAIMNLDGELIRKLAELDFGDS